MAGETDPIPVDVTRRAPGPAGLEDLFRTDLATDLERARRLATWLDSQFEVAGVRFGFDTLIGLLPVVGDTLTTLIGLFPLHVARRHKLGKLVQLRMGANLAFDWLLGLVPLAGDVADVGFKGHLRNLRLLEKAISKRGGKSG